MRQTKNKRTIAKGLLALIVSLQVISVHAQEPVNLALIKQTLIKYHNSGEYEKDITRVTDDAIQYLKEHSGRVKKPAIVFDIDETALSNFPGMQKLSFGGTLKEIQRIENLGKNPPIKPTLRLYEFAQSHHIATFFISGRPEHERKSTVKNLRKVGYTKWDGLILRPYRYDKKPAADFKTAMRKRLIAKGYNIVVNIGDQTSDLAGGYALKTFKLPNPYYLIQ